MGATDVRFSQLADISQRNHHVRFTSQKQTLRGPAEISAFCQKRTPRPLFDYFVGAADERVWDVDAEGLCRFQINDQLDFGRLLDR
jgi:hypothetical protein